MDNEKVIRVFAMRDAGMKIADIAAEFGVCPTAISHILLKRNWAHIEASAEEVPVPTHELGEVVA